SNAYEHGAAAVIFCNDDFDLQKTLGSLRKRWQAAADAIVEENAKFKAIAKPAPEDWKKYGAKIQELSEDLKKLAEQIEKAQDPLLAFDGGAADPAESRTCPVLACRRSALEPIVKAGLGTTLAALEAEIDKGPTPHSRELAGWRVVGATSVERQEAEV